MCRITGFIDPNYNGSYKIEKTAVSMRDTMIYGGPDDGGLHFDKNIGLALCHRRLSIIDLSNLGHQPMEFDNLVITFNGEVYNFKDIREDLEKEGYKFESNSDTEVVLKAFHRWGIKCVHKFRGMWAFAIWNKTEKEIILCRDRVGVKPLYWYYKDSLFMFSSELKAFHQHPKFHKEIDELSLSLFFQYGYINAPHSIFKNTYKLEPGHFLIFKNGNIKKEKYWTLEDYFNKGADERDKWLKKGENEVADELEHILTKSFKLRMVSDVPVGVFLSGGIDSSLVTALLQKEFTTPLKTFTIGFHEKKYNEAEWAKKVSMHLGTDHTELYCTPKEAYNVIPKLPELYDEPFGDSSAIPTLLVSQLAKRDVKVSLSADGGDEQFYGYERYNEFDSLTVGWRNILFTIATGIFQPEIANKLYDTFKFILPKINAFKENFLQLQEIFTISNT
ncbi:asparagine synthase (glutamine-hydrolyzing) [Spirochaetota bacterium]